MKIKGMKVSQIINTKNKKQNMEFDFFLCFTADHVKLIDARGTCAGIEGPDTSNIHFATLGSYFSIKIL